MPLHSHGTYAPPKKVGCVGSIREAFTPQETEIKSINKNDAAIIKIPPLMLVIVNFSNGTNQTKSENNCPDAGAEDYAKNT